MSHYEARELADGSGWHFTCLSDDGRVWPIGYCADHAPHPTADEAAECFRRYLLDRHLHLDGCWKDTWRRCEVCGDPTNRFAEVGLEVLPLCNDHRSRAYVEHIFALPDRMTSSY